MIASWCDRPATTAVPSAAEFVCIEAAAELWHERVECVLSRRPKSEQLNLGMKLLPFIDMPFLQT